MLEILTSWKFSYLTPTGIILRSIALSEVQKMKNSTGKRVSKWKKAILDILEKYYPNSVQLQTIYVEIGDNLLTDYAREFRRDTNEPRYHHWIRGYLGQLEDEGRAEHPKRGYWRYRP